MIADDSGRITSKRASDNTNDEVNSDDSLQPEDIGPSELVATGRVVYSRLLCQQRDYSIGQSAPSAGGDIACRKLHFHFDSSKCHTARDVQEEMANHGCVPVPYPRIRPTRPSQSTSLGG
jgi:hypothetical protein